jgi:hypothetical protein
MIVYRQKNGMKSWSIGPRVFDSEESISREAGEATGDRKGETVFIF